MSKDKAAEAADINQAEQQTDQTQTDAQEAATASFMSDPEVMAYIDQKVQEGVQKALQGKPPKANTTDPSAAERAAFRKMSYKDRLKLYNSNPHTYNKLVKGTD